MMEIIENLGGLRPGSKQSILRTFCFHHQSPRLYLKLHLRSSRNSDLSEHNLERNRKDGPQTHYEEPIQQKKRSRRTELDDDRGRHQPSISSRGDRYSFIGNQDHEVSPNSAKDKSEKAHPDDERKRISSNGIRDENDRAYTPKIVRIGLKAHHSVQAVSMDYLVEQKLSGMDSQTGEKQKQGGASKDKDSIWTSILEESVIVFSTLSFSGSSMFSRLNHGFDVVIIDEAAQAVEPATLVPLANGCKQVILVGDPVQLPATVISQTAGKSGYGVSLFQRLQRAGYPVQMLKTQYRMHPETGGPENSPEYSRKFTREFTRLQQKIHQSTAENSPEYSREFTRVQQRIHQRIAVMRATVLALSTTAHNKPNLV